MLDGPPFVGFFPSGHSLVVGGHLVCVFESGRWGEFLSFADNSPLLRYGYSGLTLGLVPHCVPIRGVKRPSARKIVPELTGLMEGEYKACWHRINL